MMPRLRLGPGLCVLAVLAAGCGNDSQTTGFGTAASITSATSPGTASTGQASDPGSSGDVTTGGEATTGTSATTNPPCAELTLCPGTTTQDPGTSTQGATTLPGTSGDGTTTTTTGDPPPDPNDACGGASDGPHCGSELGGLADHNSVYQCQGGKTQSATPCPAGCEAGACKQVQADPCASAMSGNGKYCGGTLMGGDAMSLYDCQNGKTAGKVTCNAGCQVNPPGVADACNPEGDPCQGANSGDGLYCGSGLPGGDPNSLYNCKGKATADKTVCPAGCQVNPPGVPDACKAQQNGGECCLDVPAGVVTQPYSACGNGGEHYGIDYGTAIGTPIYAGMAGTVVGSATGYPNCYNNGCTPDCWNAFNYVKIKADCGDPNNGANDLFIYYLHIDSLAQGIGNGAHVDQGQLVAKSGNSGCSSGPHIHIETVSVAKGQNATLNTCKSEDPKSDYCP